MSDSIDQQFIEFIVKSLVGKPDEVKVERTIDERGVLLELTVDPEDLGRVIGKRGGTAQSIRTLLRALGTKNDARYNLKIVDTDGGSGATRSPQNDYQASAAAPNDVANSTSDDQAEPQTEEAISDTSDVGDTSDTSDTSDTIQADEPADNPVDEPQSETVEKPESELSEKTRKSLADLDDLDI